MTIKTFLSSVLLLLILGAFTIHAQPTVTEEWAKRYSGSDSLGGGGLAMDVHGHIFAAGMSFDSSGYFNPTVIKYDGGGNQKWTSTYNTSISSYIVTGIVADNQCNSYTCGFISAGINEGESFVIKHNGAGVFQWIKLLPWEGLIRKIIRDDN